MTRVVVDASALGEFLLGTNRAESVVEALARADGDAHIPALCDVEVSAVLRRALRSDRLTVERATDAIIDLVDLPLIRHGHVALLGRILQLRDNFTSYVASSASDKAT